MQRKEMPGAYRQQNKEKEEMKTQAAFRVKVEVWGKMLSSRCGQLGAEGRRDQLGAMSLGSLQQKEAIYSNIAYPNKPSLSHPEELQNEQSLLVAVRYHCLQTARAFVIRKHALVKISRKYTRTQILRFLFTAEKHPLPGLCSHWPKSLVLPSVSPAQRLDLRDWTSSPGTR